MKVGDFIVETGNTTSYGVVLTCGRKTYDVVWINGGTSRYWHGRWNVDVVTPAEVDDFTRRQLVKEAAAAKVERARGAGIKRGQVWP